MAVAAAEIIGLLGGKQVFKEKVTEANEVRDLLRKGLPYSSIESLSQTLGIQASTITKVIGINPRTLLRRKEGSKNFTHVESDRLYRLAKVVSMAIDVIGSREKAKTWLLRPNMALGGEVPIDLLDTEVGERQVEEVLGRVLHGIYS